MMVQMSDNKATNPRCHGVFAYLLSKFQDTKTSFCIHLVKITRNRTIMLNNKLEGLFEKLD